MFVKVAIDLSLDRLFTYAVPEELTKKLAVGQLLCIPFGHREARGFAMELAQALPEGTDAAFAARIRPVAAIADETPFFSARLLDLVRKTAAYTASPIESVLRAAVPAAVLKKNARPRELMFVEPALAPAPVQMTKRLEWLYDQIVRLGGGWMTQLCRELGTTPATLRELGSRGLVRVSVKARRRNPLSHMRVLRTTPRTLNAEQAAALAVIAASKEPVLLHGITGSGKTEVYLQAIAAELEAGRGAIVMVPEISLTPQTVQRFAGRFGDRVAVLHSALSDGERYDEWHRIRSGTARVVIGPRSAVWAPVANLGLIVVDEEHETSYKQEDLPRYNARDVAVLRGKLEGAKVVLGSATPSLESWMNVKRGKYALSVMAKRAGAGTLPAVKLVEMRDGAIFSKELLEAIRLRLDRGEQTILFLNRRGYSRSVTCNRCGYVAECPDCSLPYTYHRADDCLRCHVCGGWTATPKACPACKSPDITYKGIGTQRVEAALKACFPRAAVLRMDADSTSRKNSHDDILRAFGNREADILVGTQMIAKGLDFPNVTLVGALNAASSLNMPDFRASERTFQLLAQVAGRAGRAELPGEVLVQSFDVSAMAIRTAACGEYAQFAEAELKERRDCGMPPFCHLAMIGIKSKDAGLASDWAAMYAASLSKVAGLKVSEALPSVIEKAEGWYRWQVMVRAAESSRIVKAWRWISAVRPPPGSVVASIDIDAVNLI